MIKLKSLLLLETHVEDLYHATYHSELLQILQDNAIKLSFTGGTQADLLANKGYHYFLSTSRTKYGQYARGGLGDNNKIIGQDVIIHLNGKRLTAAGFKTFWVDFWGMGNKYSEEEERIASMNKDEITPLSNYVKDIHVYVNNKELKNPFCLDKLHKMNELAKRFNNFPIYFYPSGTEEYFKAQRTEKAVRDIAQIFPQQPEWTSDDLEHKKWLDSNVGTPERYQRNTKILRTFLDIYYEKQVDINNYPGKSVMNWILYHPHDAYSQIYTEIHNLKKQHPPIFREIVNVLKKEKLKTVKDLITLVISRETLKEKRRREIQYQNDIKTLQSKKI